MGMVHERPRVVRRQELGAGSARSAGESHAVIEPATVLEIREDERSVATPAAGIASLANSASAAAGEGNKGGNGVVAAPARFTAEAEPSESTAGGSAEVTPRAG
jgi:hypothetical protein